MRVSSPLPSPPSPGSGASPSNAANLAAHRRLAAIDPFADRDRLFDGILAALLTAAHAERGLLVDPAQPERFAGAGVELSPAVLEALAARGAGIGRVTDPLPEPASASLFGPSKAGTADVPAAIPLTARDNVLALLVLEKPPTDPVGFASVTAHAARILDSVRMADKVQKADFELKYRVWELESLYDVGLSIAGTLDFESLAEDILYKSMSLLNARTGTLIVCDRAADAPVYVRHLGEPLLHREAVEKEKMEREMELAASIQRTILPDTLPDVPGLVISGANRPAKQVGGDYFDVYPLADGRTAFCVADVSGKGVPAALLVSTVHACLHLLVPNNASDLPGLVARVNRHLVGFSSTRKFATLFIAVFDPAAGTLTYVNAGHNPGLWISPGGVNLLPSGGVPVGMMPGVVHKQASIRVAPGDTILLYSDGITEALNGSDEEFGMERLTALAIAGRVQAPAELSRRIFGAVNDFTTGVAQYDDQTVLIARVSAAS